MPLLGDTMKVLDLFSGIGGFSLGLERAGFKTVAFCEIEPFCRKVLKKHWPDVPIYEDVRELNANMLKNDGIAVDVICGGFPCQDISNAGAKAGIDGKRSGLWSEYARLIGELQPRYVIVENVAALLHRGMGRVLGDLAKIGYDAEWHCIPACYVGAPHERDRLWIVAYPNSYSESDSAINAGEVPKSDMAHSIGIRLQGPRLSIYPSNQAKGGKRQATDAFHGGIGEIWKVEPAICRVADGVPHRVDRLSALGNAVVPQIPEIIGRAILFKDIR